MKICGKKSFQKNSITTNKQPVICFPNAKINIGLHVTEKRTDGYHNIETVFYPVGWKDALEIIPEDPFSFHAEGLKISGALNDNLCIKAYDLLKKDFAADHTH